MHVLTAPHVQIVASKSILSKNCDTFCSVVNAKPFHVFRFKFCICTTQQNGFPRLLANERSDKHEILSRQTCTNDSVILFTASSSRALISNGPINSALNQKSVEKVSEKCQKSWSSGNGSAPRAVNSYICDPILEKVVKGELVQWRLNSFKRWCLN